MQAHIDELEEEKDYLMGQIKNPNDEFSDDVSLRIDAQSTKIQTLLELLEKSEVENNHLREQISDLKSKGDSKGEWGCDSSQ